MYAWVRRALCAVGLTGGIVLLGIGLAEAASADGNNGPVTSGQNGILSGNQTGVDAQAPINLSGNQITVIGQDNQAGSTGASTSSAPTAGSGGATTSGQDGVGSGNQTAVGAQAPVNVSGNQVTVIGQDNKSGAAGGATTSGSAAGGGAAGSGPASTSGEGGLGSGNQTAAGAQAPVNVSGNQITVIGQDNAAQSAAGSSSGAGGGAGAAPTTTGEDGLVAGNQTGIGLTLPVILSGNQVTVIGQDNTAQSASASSSGAGGGAAAAPTTTGEDGLVAGNQTGIGLTLPVNLSGNQVTVIGQDNTDTSTGASTAGGSGATTGGTAGATTSGQSGIVSGNQTGVNVLAPIGATGNQVTAVGQDNAVTSAGGSSTGSGSTGPGQTTTGEGGVGSGNQTPVGLQLPVDVSGNQVTVIGQDNTVTSTGGSSSGGTPPATTPPGGVVSPPGSPAPGGGTPSAPQGSGGPGETSLPNTGASSDLLGLGVLGLILLSAGLALGRPRRLTVR